MGPLENNSTPTAAPITPTESPTKDRCWSGVDIHLKNSPQQEAASPSAASPTCCSEEKPAPKEKTEKPRGQQSKGRVWTEEEKQAAIAAAAEKKKIAAAKKAAAKAKDASKEAAATPIVAAPAAADPECRGDSTPAEEVPKYRLKKDWTCYREAKKCKKCSTFEDYLEHIQYHCPSRKTFTEERTAADVKPSDAALAMTASEEATKDSLAQVIEAPLTGDAPEVPSNNTSRPVLIGISPGNAFFTLVNCLRVIHLAVRSGYSTIKVTCMGDLHSVNGSDLAPSVIRRHHNKAVSRLADLEYLVDTLFPEWKTTSAIEFVLWNQLLDARHLECRNKINKTFAEEASFKQSILDITASVAKMRNHSAPAAQHYLLEETAALTIPPLNGQGLDYFYPGKNFQTQALLKPFLTEGEQFVSHIWVREPAAQEVESDDGACGE